MNPEAAEQSLINALAYLQALFVIHNARSAGKESTEPAPVFPEADSPLQRLTTRLQLSTFERDLLLLCVAVELDSVIARLCAGAQSSAASNAARVLPTFSLALALLPNAHWTALHPEAPLRHYGLLRLVGNDDNKDSLTLTPLRIEESVLHYLLGLPPAEERLRPYIEWLPSAPSWEATSPTVKASVEQLRQAWIQDAPPRLALLSGGDGSARREIVRHASEDVAVLSFALLATLSLQERDNVLRLWEREVVLAPKTVLVEIGEDSEVGASRDTLATVLQRVAALPGRVILSVGERSQPFVTGILAQFIQSRSHILVEVNRPDRDEQRAAWQRILTTNGITANESENTTLVAERLVGQFDLAIGAIESVGASLLVPGVSPKVAPTPEAVVEEIWDRCRIVARPRLEELAERMETWVTWDDLVLPSGTQQLLLDIAAHTRARVVVADRWGFGKRGGRGLGISALFSGPSGTGKTLAAEVLASELRLDLYRIDLSSLISKYIGETEKNLRRVFDAAEAGGAILLFDEADALFGRRSEVKDSHDRYANIEVSYLLQRMENYSGLAILTTNLKASMDIAFLRRLRFAVSFPFPDIVQRTRMWERAFPPETPTEGLDAETLAQLNVAGGNIRSMALYAASLAADQGQPVRMSHLLRAARAEYAKLEKPLTGAEIDGWMDTEKGADKSR